jgi:hypothetical protein
MLRSRRKLPTKGIRLLFFVVGITVTAAQEAMIESGNCEHCEAWNVDQELERAGWAVMGLIV